MGLWDALSGKTYAQNKLVGNNAAEILSRCEATSRVFEEKWCVACLVGAHSFVGKLLFEELKGRKRDGGVGDINPFRQHRSNITPQGAMHLFRLSAIYRMAAYMAGAPRRALLESNGGSEATLEGAVSRVFRTDDEDRATYYELRSAFPDNAMHGFKLLHDKMVTRAIGIEPIPDIAVITFVSGLLSATDQVFSYSLEQGR